ncbi:hypothetical protein [Klebsiella phage phiKp_21]|nr:hypothetical protein [Klebsiella phage phiKp_21]
MNEKLALIWKSGYDFKVTPKELRVFRTEYCEYLDLDQYNTIVRIEHNGDVEGHISEVLDKAISIIEAK